MELTKVDLFTDGACSGNPGAGGWGAILRCKGTEKELSGGSEMTTNNKMELTAVIEGLKALNRPCHVTLYTDSKYVADGISKGWAASWKARGWRKKTESRHSIQNFGTSFYHFANATSWKSFG